MDGCQGIDVERENKIASKKEGAVKNWAKLERKFAMGKSQEGRQSRLIMVADYVLPERSGDHPGCCIGCDIAVGLRCSEGLEVARW